MKSNYLLIYFLLLSCFGFAQGYDIGGVVKETGSGLPIPGVNVQVKNATKGTLTDFDGKFSLKGVPAGSKIVFTYVGFKTVEYNVTSSNANLAISLQEDTKSLDEVVVLGYSSKRKKDITGAVAIVGSETIADLRPVKLEQALQGTVAGVTVSSNSGAPGAGFDVRIRGIATNGNSKATIILDGIPVPGQDLGTINPDDVESIVILKDAQAAIYGTLGANGIVLVTTKMGKKNSKAKFSFNSYTGFQETTKKLSMLNATEYALLLNESYVNNGQEAPYADVSNLGDGTNWQDKVFEKAPIMNNDFTVSGGSDKITYSLSGSDLKQEGIVGGEKSGFKRSTARLALGVDLSSKLKLQTNFAYTFIKRRSLNENGLGSVLFNALNVPAIQPVYENGDFSLVPSTPGYGIEVINPLAQIANTYNDYNLKKLNGNVKLTYDILKDLKFTSRFGFATSNSKSKTFAKELSYGGKVFDVTRSRVDQNGIQDNDYSLDLFAEYEKSLFENHKIKFTLGTTISKQFGNGLYASGYDVPNNSWEFADINLAKGTGGAGVRDVSSYQYDERRLSHFAFLDYSYKGKYLISGTIRRDLSTKFGPDKRKGIFPAFTAGWVVSEENFFSKEAFLNFMKIRGSYGVLGNDQIGDNRYLGTLTGEATYVFNGALVNGTAIGVLPNPAIQWEEAKKLDLGLDLRLWKDKIDITADYFEENREALLIQGIPVSGITGVAAPGSGSPTVNAGTVSNKGYEFSIRYKEKLSENFNLDFGFNITTIDNEVIEVRNSTGYIEGGGFGVSQPLASRMESGHSLGYFYGYVTDGIFQNQAEIDAHPTQAAMGTPFTAPGDIKFRDINGDGKIDVNDKTDIGDPIADYTLGFNLNFSYKSFDFVSYTYASVGNELVRNYERVVSDVNKLNYTLDRWTGEGTSNSVPRVTTGATNNNLFSDYFVEDASFLRIQNVQLGYTINKNATERMGLSKVRIYASANNVYTFTKYRGFDPSALGGGAIGSGIDYGFYPVPRTYLVGFNLQF